MATTRRGIVSLAAGAVAFWSSPAVRAGAELPQSADTLRAWYRLVLELVRHTPTYSPPVASRALAYLGVAAYEAVASGNPQLRSLAGQLNGLAPLPRRDAAASYDDTVVIDRTLAVAVESLFGNTGPTGHHVMTAFAARQRAAVSAGLAPDVVARSEAHAAAIFSHVLEWSRGDGGAVIANMGFPLQYTLTEGPAHWVPTSAIAQQQLPLLPAWGNNRSFAMPDGGACPLPAPPAYSEDRNSEFFRQALEVCDTVKSLTPEQRTIARFWSDDPMLSPTPPGHWIGIALDLLERQGASLDVTADTLARLGVAVADAFIACWHSKFEFDLVRPVTYIRRVIDPKWEPLLITPPFPEYPSGHSTQSAAAAEVLTALFGDAVAFDDTTHRRDGLAPRHFASFRAAAAEAGMSRLYGGIHFRAAIERGLDQGRCVAAHVNALRTRS